MRSFFLLPYKSPWRWQFTWFDRRFRGAGETMTFWRQKSCVIKVGPNIRSWIPGHLGYEIDNDSDDNLTLAIKRGSWIQSGNILPNGEILRKSRPNVISNCTPNPFFQERFFYLIHPYFINCDLKRKISGSKSIRNPSAVHFVQINPFGQQKHRCLERALIHLLLMQWELNLPSSAHSL